MVWITDGEGNNTYSVHGDPAGISYTKKLIIQDKIMKKQYPISGRRRNITDQLFRIIKDRLGCNVVGFFLDGEFGKKNPILKYINFPKITMGLFCIIEIYYRICIVYKSFYRSR